MIAVDAEATCPPPPPPPPPVDHYELIRLREEAMWREKRAAMSMLLDDTDAVMSSAEFNQLGEYSCTLPTGTYVGKLWKCQRPYYVRPGDEVTWWLGEYWDDGTPDRIAIRWRRIHLVD